MTAGAVDVTGETPPGPGSGERRRRMSRGRVAMAAAPVALAGLLVWEPAVSGPTICPFALVTGHACPLCGGTRAASAVVGGDWAEAWSLHPLVFIVLPLLAAGWLTWLGTTRGWWNPWSPRAVNRIWAVLGVLFLVVWIARFATGTLPPV